MMHYMNLSFTLQCIYASTGWAKLNEATVHFCL